MSADELIEERIWELLLKTDGKLHVLRFSTDAYDPSEGTRLTVSGGGESLVLSGPKWLKKLDPCLVFIPSPSCPDDAPLSQVSRADYVLANWVRQKKEGK